MSTPSNAEHPATLALTRALQVPTRYPTHDSPVTLVETDISWLLLAGDFVYKIKKPL